MNKEEIDSMIVEDFKERFDRLTCDKSNYDDVINTLMSVVDSKDVQEIVVSKYLEYKGYDLDDLREEAIKLIDKLK